jgi:hypothetical protein
MTPRDDISSNDVPQESTTDHPVTLETVAIEELPQEVDNWAQSEGYTPLSTLAAGGGAMFMAMPPDDDDGPSYTFHTSGEGAFFANIAAFGTDQDTPEAEVAAEQLEQEQDYRSIADQALRVLDEEYTMTLHGINVEKEKEESSQPSSILDASQQSETLQVSEATQEDLVKPAANDAKRQKDDAKPRVLAPLPKIEPLPPAKEIDTDAVQKAFAAIQLKQTKVSQRYEEWQQTLPPKEHGIIPPAPLSAFRKTTTKARQATSNLSRSATVAHALQRLEILSAPSATEQSSKQHLILHMLGVDRVETLTVEQIRITFGPLVRWLAASSSSPESVKILLIGPNVVTQPPVDLMPAKSPTGSSLRSATAISHLGAYHELNSLHTEASPDLAVAFNAGIWGYDEWKPTLDLLKGVTLVITAYTLEEAEDDAEVLEKQLGMSSKPLWASEPNPFGSNVQRETKSIQNRVYRENAAWQAWGPR